MLFNNVLKVERCKRQLHSQHMPGLLAIQCDKLGTGSA